MIISEHVHVTHIS